MDAERSRALGIELTVSKGDEIIAASNLNQLVTGVKIAGNSGEEAGSAPDERGTPSNGGAAGGRGGRGRGGQRGGGE